MKNLSVLLCLLAAFTIRAQSVCNVNGNIMLFTNYNGGTLTINVDQNIPNLKIGICSYEACQVNLSGAFVSNVTEVRYAGFNSANNTNCGSNIATTAITGAPGTAVTSIAFTPTATLANSNGYHLIICGYSCNNSANQGGCNTVDQVEAYFGGVFAGSALYAHKVQYGCWTGTQSLSIGGNCCPLPPVYPGIIAGSQTVCAGTTLAPFLSNSSATVSAGTIGYQWQSSTTSASNGFSNISGANGPTYAPGSPSQVTYYRRAASTTTNNAVYSNVLTANVLPLPQVTISGSSSVCVGVSATLTANGGTSYAWSAGAGIGSGIVITPTASAVISVTCFAANGCSATASQPLLVNPIPTITVGPASYSACAGQTLILTAGGGVTYTWLPGNLNGASVTVSLTSSVIYTVIAQNQAGCIQQRLVPVQVNPLPVIGITGSPTLVCTGKIIGMNASGATVYNWAPGNLVGPSVTITAQSPVTYTAFGYDQGCVNTMTISIIPLPSPTVSLLANRQKLCAGEKAVLTASGAISYTLLNTSAAVLSTVQITPTASATYTLVGSAPNGCTESAINSITVSSCTGIDNAGFITELGIKLYPNPNSGEFYISSEKNVKLNLFSNAGQLIKMIELREENSYQVKLTDLAAGIYFIGSASDQNAARQKIVVLK